MTAYDTVTRRRGEKERILQITIQIKNRITNMSQTQRENEIKHTQKKTR